MQWRATAESMLQHRQDAGEEPLWANNVFSGMPGLVISPPGTVFQVDRLPAWLRLVSWPLSHAIVLLLGTYAFACYLTRDKLLGLCAACAFGLTTYLPIILVAGHNTKYVALAFAPWLLLAFVHTLRRPGVLACLLFAVAVAVSMRAGHIQIPYYMGMIGLVWWAVELVGAVRNATIKKFAWSTLYLAAGALIGFLMVMQIYWPMYEYKAFTIRGMASGGGAGALDWAYAMGWSQGPAELLTLLVADAFGGGGLYWGPKIFTGGPHYVGGIVLLLAILAAWRLRTHTARALGIAAVLMTLFSLGRHFEVLNRFMFEHFPLFDAFRTPEAWLIAVALALAILAALGLGYVIQEEAARGAERSKSRAVYTVAGIVMGFTLLLYVGQDAFLSFEKPGEREQIQGMVAQRAQRPLDDPDVIRATGQIFEEQIAGPRADAFRQGAARTLVLLLIATAGLVLFRRRMMPAWLLQMLIIVLVTFDLGGIARQYLGEDHLSVRRDPARRIQTLDADRFILDRKAEAGGPGHFRVLSLENPDQTKLGRPSFHHESLGGYSGAKLRLYQDFLEHILTNPVTGLPNQNALDMMNVRYIIAQSPIPGTQVVYQGDLFMVLENTDALPRAMLIGEAEVITEAKDTWSRLQNDSFDPHATVLLAEPLDADIAPVDSSSVASVSMERYGPREMAFAVETDQPRLLLISEVYYPAGWRATIDGVEAPIRRANYLLRAIHVPAGVHEVVLRFDPASYTVGKRISLVSMLLVYLSIAGLAGMTWYRRRRKA